MPRVKGGSVSDRKRKKLFKITKGYYGRRKNVYRRAKEAYLKALSHAYTGRKNKKRDFRSLWIIRINAAARERGITYNKFIHGLKLAGISINRKMLAEMAVNDATAFDRLVEIAKEKCGEMTNQ